MTVILFALVLGALATHQIDLIENKISALLAEFRASLDYAASEITPAPQSAACRELSGAWENGLGSSMHLTPSANGGLSGTYQSAVGSGAGVTFKLAGRFEPASARPTTLGFAVSWSDAAGNVTAHSTTAWSGVVLNDVIYTTWLLTSSVNSSDDLWSAMRVGTDVFQRAPKRIE